MDSNLDFSKSKAHVSKTELRFCFVLMIFYDKEETVGRNYCEAVCEAKGSKNQG